MEMASTALVIITCSFVTWSLIDYTCFVFSQSYISIEIMHYYWKIGQTLNELKYLLISLFCNIYLKQSASIHPSVIPSVRPSVRPKRKSSHSHNFSPILTKFLHHVSITENFYSMQFHKKVAKIVAVATVFFKALMHVCLCLFLTWKHEGNFLSYFHNIFIKVQHNFSAIFCKFWQKLLPWQHFHFALFLICSLQKMIV